MSRYIYIYVYIYTGLGISPDSGSCLDTLGSEVYSIRGTWNCTVMSLGFRAQGLGFRVYGSGFRV